MMNTTRNWFMLSLLVGISLVTVVSVEAQPPSETDGFYNDQIAYRQLEPEQDPEPEIRYLIDLIKRYGQTMMRRNSENNKRTVDFGLARGFSGTQEAKHRLGLAAANFAGGPGRKRRSDDAWSTMMASAGHA